MVFKLVLVLAAALAVASAGYIGSPYYSSYTLRSAPYAYSSIYSPYTYSSYYSPAYSAGYAYSPYAYSGLGYGYGSYLYR